MDETARALTDQERLLVDEELTWLTRVRASLSAARATRARAEQEARLRPDAVDVVRALRHEAASASEDDLPGLLHELSVRKTLLERGPKDPLPSADSPYIAHLRLREGGRDKDYFLGQSNHLDNASGVRILDWRVAPLSRIFYGYREGDEYEEEFPGRVAEGTVVARRVLVIEDGELRRIVTDQLVLARASPGEWCAQTRASHAIVGGGAGSAVRADALTSSLSRPAPSVTALLDARQFAAISAPPEQPLLVLGSAGSGKTTVALHRLARIAALDPERYAHARLQVIVPEEGLARLSRRLLAPLGLHGAQVQTLDEWASSLARRLFGTRLPRLCSETPALVTSLKRHPALYAALRERLAHSRASRVAPSLKRLRRLTAELFSDRDFLNGVVDAARGTLSRATVEATVRHTMLQLADSVDRQLAAVVDRSRLRTLDGREIAEGTPEALAGTLDSEDLPIFLAILAWRQQLPPEPAAHLVLDEAEDFSLFELHVLGRLQGTNPSITLAGDEAQQTASSFAGFEQSLSEFGARNTEVCRLSVSYRCPRPIFELAQQVLGNLASPDAKSAARDGAPVGHFAFPTEELATLFSVGEVVDLAQREPDASIAVIAHDADAARRFHALLPERAQARLVLAGEFTFEAGIDVTDLDSVKGLEFDYVLVPQVSAATYPLNDEARHRLHVAVTRAVWQLWLVSGGNRSPILAEPKA
ncbi:MAG TPA: ATP-binding domain-containing protein [Polyangiaceae bacterium]|nr:ATP-binding domain-containing protein [Polyangiaceae bacterium]